MEKVEQESQGLQRYLSPLSVWALSFGCAVGWGSFVMPGTTFLPGAGPLGTALGIGIGAVIMMIIGMNYHYLMNKYPQAGGTLTYANETFGHDHGFLAAWFLILVYVAIIWANATALALICRNLFGNMFQFGFHYSILGYDVYFGEVFLTMVAIVLVGFICMFGKQMSVAMQVVFALILFFGILVSFIFVFREHIKAGVSYSPAFADNGMSRYGQIIKIVALSPWAFVGFESVSNSTEGFRFPLKKSFGIMLAALVTGAVSYILLNQMAISFLPKGYKNWSSYIGELGNLGGLKGLPTFYAANRAMGKTGLLLMGFAAVAGIMTGLIGNYIAASRLIYSMSKEGILRSWFGELSEEGVPKNAVLFLVLVSLPIPFLGRTAIGWIIDVNTVGATVAYGYTSAAALVNAKRDGNKRYYVTGIIGLVMSVLFFFFFMSWSAHAMATESYLVLAFWSILGFIYFRRVFAKDRENRFGKSTVVWIGLLFVIFFTTLMWVKQATDDMTKNVVTNIREYYEEKNPDMDESSVRDTEMYLDAQMNRANRALTRNSVIQMTLIVASLAIMFSIYRQMEKREQKAMVEKARAEETSHAKSTFLSNMSHDIRTPMNAIIGYINLAEDEKNDLPAVRSYLTKIKTSSRHLLALINDVLEMSRIESGKMDLEPVAVDLKKLMRELNDMFDTQMQEKKIDFLVDASQVKNSHVYCDKNRFNRVLLNLVSNAYKFTPEGGSISVTMWEVSSETPHKRSYELRVKDSGIGMTGEFAEKVFEAFERERSSTVSKIQGSGLGMAITKSIVDLMGGTIELITAPGEGTEFVIRVSFELVQGQVEEEDEIEKKAAEDAAEDMDFSEVKLLLAEDIEINREIALMLLSNFGFRVDWVENGKEAVKRIAASSPGDYGAVLMDIQMPVMDGYEATKEIRSLENKELAEIPIIAMTANAFSEDVKKAEDAGMNGHVAKPIDANVLLNTLKDVLK